MSVENRKNISAIYAFDFSGGCLCLDFANTVSDRAIETPRDHLQGYQDLVSWSLQAGILTPEEAQQLLVQAERRGEEAELIYRQALELREAIFRIFLALALGEAVPQGDLALLNASLTGAMAHAQLEPQDNRFAWGWAESQGALDCMLWRVVRSAADVLVSDEMQAVKVCAADDCNWLFLDSSKNQSRRWCDMKGCGNRAKVRKHHERRKQAARLDSLV